MEERRLEYPIAPLPVVPEFKKGDTVFITLNIDKKISINNSKRHNNTKSIISQVVYNPNKEHAIYIMLKGMVCYEEELSTTRMILIEKVNCDFMT
ncbi:MAG: hypothetical protein Q8O88_04030 [bacterium]|nr:hypothetical protein [bacterium]